MRKTQLLFISVTLAFSVVSGRSAIAEDAKTACVRSYTDAQSLRANHKLMSARAQLRACGQAQCGPFMNGGITKDCTDWLAQVDAAIPSVVLSVQDAAGNDVVNANVWMDGAQIATKVDGHSIEVEPGSHLFTVEAANVPKTERQVVVLEGKKNQVVRLSPGAASEAPSSASSSAPAQETKSESTQIRLVNVSFARPDFGYEDVFEIRDAVGKKICADLPCTTKVPNKNHGFQMVWIRSGSEIPTPVPELGQEAPGALDARVEHTTGTSIPGVFMLVGGIVVTGAGFAALISASNSGTPSGDAQTAAAAVTVGGLVVTAVGLGFVIWHVGSRDFIDVKFTSSHTAAAPSTKLPSSISIGILPGGIGGTF